MKNLFKIPEGTICEEDQTNYAGMKRIILRFKNGNSISIIMGKLNYEGVRGFYEIMPDDKLGLLKNYIVGWLTAQDVNEYIEILSGN